MNRRNSMLLWVAALALALFVTAGCTRIDPVAELAAARENLAAREYGEAGVRLSNVVQAEPDNPEARRLRGELAMLIGDYTGAVADLERARALGADPDAVALALAEALAASGQPARALDVLDSTRTRTSAYWPTLAEALLGLGRVAEAELALAEADGADGTAARVQVARARVAFARNDVAAAQGILAEALRDMPNDPHVLMARADLYARSERLPEAAADLERVAELYAAAGFEVREATALLALAQVHLARNDLEAAERTVSRLTERAPQAAIAGYLRALVAYRRGNFTEAAAQVQPLVAASPDTVQFRALLGAIHLAQGNLGQAEQQFVTVLNAVPGDPAATKLLAETRLRQQRPEAALAALRVVDDAAADDPQISMLSGLASLLTGNSEQGVLYLEEAASRDPGNELLRLQLARAYMAVGRDADAAALLEGSFGAGSSARLEAGLLKLFAEARLGAADSTTAQELLTEYPRDPRVLTAVAIHAQLQGDVARARELFEQAAQLETEGATARLFVAGALVQEGRNQEAEQLLSRVLDEQPTNTQVLTALAELATARTDYERAAELLRRAIDSSSSVAPRLALVQLFLRQGDVAAAHAAADEAAAVAADNPEVIAVSGLVALVEGRYADATTLLRRAASELPNRLGVALALARAELASGEAEAARATLQRMATIAPQSLPLRMALGEAELRLGNATEALSIAAALKTEFPTQSEGYLLEGEVQIAARRYVAAADSLRAAYDREPSWPLMTRLLGTLRLAERVDDALRMSEAWVAENPRHVAGLLTAAGLHQDAGRERQALRHYETALSVDATNLIALNNAAWLAQRLGNPGALALAERAYEVAPDNAAVLDTLGVILMAQNREQEAVVHLGHAAELAPDAAEIRYHLAQGLAALGRSAEARSVLTTLLDGNAEFEQRAEARQLLDSL